MKHIILLIFISLFIFSCQNDNWKDEIEDLKKELAVHKQLIDALQKGITIKGVTQTDNGYSIEFSDGNSIILNNGKTSIIAIGDNGNWFIDGVDTGKSSQGEDGITPNIKIGINGNWFINGIDTGTKAQAINGTNGKDAPFIISIMETSAGFVFYLSDGSSILASKDLMKIAAWGDSLTPGYINTLQKMIGNNYKLINCAVGGESSLTIAARQGGIPMVLNNDVTLPADLTPAELGDKTNSLRSSYNNQMVTPLLQGGELTINNCTINDVECILKWTGKTWNDPNGLYTLQRAVEGELVTLNEGSILYTSAMMKYRNLHANVFFMGQNGGFSGDITKLIDQYKKMIEFSGSNNYIVIGFHKNGTIDKMREYEMGLQQAFGAKFINLREYMSTRALSDAGLVPTNDDIEAMNVGLCPPQLLADNVHFTAIGNKLLATLIYNRFRLIGIVR